MVQKVHLKKWAVAVLILTPFYGLVGVLALNVGVHEYAVALSGVLLAAGITIHATEEIETQ